MAPLGDIQGLSAAMNAIERAAQKLQKESVKKAAEAITKACAYESSVLYTEVMQCADEDCINVYDPDSATLLKESHAAANFGDIITPVITYKDDGASAQITFYRPEKTPLTDAVKVCQKICIKNGRKRAGY